MIYAAIAIFILGNLGMITAFHRMSKSVESGHWRVMAALRAIRIMNLIEMNRSQQALDILRLVKDTAVEKEVTMLIKDGLDKAVMLKNDFSLYFDLMIREGNIKEEDYVKATNDASWHEGVLSA